MHTIPHSDDCRSDVQTISRLVGDPALFDIHQTVDEGKHGIGVEGLRKFN